MEKRNNLAQAIVTYLQQPINHRTGGGDEMSKEMCPIKIKDLKALAIKHDMQAIVLLTVERNGTVSVVTYGENVEKCKAIGDWGQGLWKHCVSLIPFQSVFGWGNNGVPVSEDILRKGR